MQRAVGAVCCGCSVQCAVCCGCAVCGADDSPDVCSTPRRLANQRPRLLIAAAARLQLCARATPDSADSTQKKDGRL